MTDLKALRERVESRASGIAKWLDDEAAEVFVEQRHVEDGSEERAYWHYGYMVACRDILALLAALDGDTPNV